jgi:hypothetical protein
MAVCWTAMAVVAYVLDLLNQTRLGLSGDDGRPFGDDFINHWSAAYLAWHDRLASIYDLAAFHAFHDLIAGATLQPYHYDYPPVFLVLTGPFAALPYVPALGMWLVTGWLAFWQALRLAWPRGAIWLAMATPAVLVNAISGQNGLWTATFLGGGLCLVDRRPRIAGVLLGLLIFKPHLAVIAMVAMLAGRRWSVIIAAGATAVALVGLSVGLFGVESWKAWAQMIELVRRFVVEDSTGVWHRMVSIFIFARRLGAVVPMAYLVQAVAAVAAVAVVALAWWRGTAPAGARSALVVLGACLATPYMHDYDLVMGAFVVAWLAGESRIDKRSTWISAAVLLTPVVSAPIARWTGFTVGPLLLVPAFWLVAARCFEGGRAVDRPAGGREVLSDDGISVSAARR